MRPRLCVSKHPYLVSSFTRNFLSLELPAVAKFSTSEKIGHCADGLTTGFALSQMDWDEYTLPWHSLAKKAQDSSLMLHSSEYQEKIQITKMMAFLLPLWSRWPNSKLHSSSPMAHEQLQILLSWLMVDRQCSLRQKKKFWPCTVLRRHMGEILCMFLRIQKIKFHLDPCIQKFWKRQY